MKICEEKVYAFTNENLCSYEKLYGFNGQRVITPAASGDQYFTSIFYGAKDIELYDININTWYYFVLKFFAILVLSYDEFYELFIVSRLKNLKLLSKVIACLPDDIKEYLLKFTYTKDGLHNLIMFSILSDNEINFTTDRIIPYLTRKNYERLRRLLENLSELPTFYHTDLINLPELLEKKEFDLLLTSNIYHYLSFKLAEYKEFLDQFPADVIQALYTWILSKEEINTFLENGFEVAEAAPVEKLSWSVNYVLTLRK